MNGKGVKKKKIGFTAGVSRLATVQEEFVRRDRSIFPRAIDAAKEATVARIHPRFRFSRRSIARRNFVRGAALPSFSRFVLALWRRRRGRAKSASIIYTEYTRSVLAATIPPPLCVVDFLARCSRETRSVVVR
jgi:hypothetical protein